jgi:type IV pilus assembly protein PilB
MSEPSSSQPKSDKPAGAAAAAPRERKMPPVEQLRGRQLGRILIKMGRIRRAQVHEALDIQKTRHGPIGKILVELGHITEEDLNIALAAQSGMEVVDLGKVDVAPDVVARMTAQMANTYQTIPFEYIAEQNELYIALGSPDNFVATDDLRTLLSCNVRPFLSNPKAIQNAIERYYPEGEKESISGLIDELADDDDLAAFKDRGDSIDLAELKEMADLNPVKKLLNLVLLQAIKDQASDIHFEPFEDEFKMRYRIDGVLYEMVPPPKLRVDGDRLAYQGHGQPRHRRAPPAAGRPYRAAVEGPPVDLRVAVLPTMFGESVVLRVLDRSNVQLDLDRLGLREDDLATFRQLIRKPNGIVLSPGPPARARPPRSTRRSCELNTGPRPRFSPAEDPVEYDIDGLVQFRYEPRCRVDLRPGAAFLPASGP